MISLFHYLAIAFGLLYTATALRLINALPHALKRSSRDWLYAGFLCTTLVAVVVSFWDFGALRGIEWTLPRFMLALVRPGIIYFIAATLTPEAPDEVTAWRSYFLSVRLRYFAALALVGCVSAAQDALLLGRTPDVSQALAVLVGIVGVLSSNPKVLAGALITLAVYVLATVIGAEPTWIVDLP